MDSNTPTPQEIAAFLARRVIGQDEAVTELSIALTKRLGRLPVGNVLMIGSSGNRQDHADARRGGIPSPRQHRPKHSARSSCGSMRTCSAKRPSRADPAMHFCFGCWSGLGRCSARRPPWRRCWSTRAAAWCFVDEIDKIRTHVTDQVNIAGIRAQEAS